VSPLIGPCTTSHNPGQQFRLTAEAGATLPDLDEGLLHQIVRSVRVPHGAQAIAVKQPEIRAIQRPQRALDTLAAFATSLHEYQFVQIDTRQLHASRGHAPRSVTDRRSK
jgi:hypothetical protein